MVVFIIINKNIKLKIHQIVLTRVCAVTVPRENLIQLQKDTVSGRAGGNSWLEVVLEWDVANQATTSLPWRNPQLTKSQSLESHCQELTPQSTKILMTFYNPGRAKVGCKVVQR